MKIKIEKRGNLDVLFFDLLDRLPSVRHAVFLRFDPASLTSYRAGKGSPFPGEPWRFHTEFMVSGNLPAENLILLRQVHGNSCIQVTKENSALIDGTNGDCLLTGDPSLAIAVKTADCFPLLLANAQKGVVSCIHAGWRGITLSIIESCLQKMECDFSCRAEDTYVAVGPGIEQCCYKVREDAIDFFRIHNLKIDAHLIRNGDSSFLSLSGIINEKLIRGGIRKDHIIHAGICTCCSDLHLPSFRRDGNGLLRTISAVMLM